MPEQRAVIGQAEVLIVDDEPFAREALTLHRPDVLVADIGMPEEDGYSLLQALRREEQAHHEQRIPALAVTAFARLEDRQRALAASFDEHLPKPVDPDRLLAAVAMLVRRPAKSPCGGDTR